SADGDRLGHLIGRSRLCVGKADACQGKTGASKESVLQSHPRPRLWSQRFKSRLSQKSLGMRHIGKIYCARMPHAAKAISKDGRTGAGDANRTRDPNLGKVMLYP